MVRVVRPKPQRDETPVTLHMTRADQQLVLCVLQRLAVGWCLAVDYALVDVPPDHDVTMTQLYPRALRLLQTEESEAEE